MKKFEKIMKKTLCLLATLLISAEMLLAVPSGIYCDKRGRRNVLIQSNTIYNLDSDGKVMSTWMVVRENSDGSFAIKPVVNGQPVGSANPNNAWWTENGKIYLNLATQLNTLVKE